MDNNNIDIFNSADTVNSKGKFDSYVSAGYGSKTIGTEQKTLLKNRDGLLFTSGAECSMTPNSTNLSVRAGLGVNTPVEGLSVEVGMASSVSIFHKNAQHNIYPMLKATKEVGKNTKISATIQPLRNDIVRIGAQFTY